MENARHNPDVGFGLARSFSRLPMPLQPACGIDQRAILFRETCRWQLEDFRLNARRIGRVLRPEILPESRCLRIERVHRDEVFELAQAAANLAAVREGLKRIEALADVAVHLPV